MKFKLLSEREESIAEKIGDAAHTVHKALGPGLLERVCKVCFCQYNLCVLVPWWLNYYIYWNK